MTMAAMQIILFGDEISDLRVALRRINQRKGNSVLLWSFLEKLNAALREEVGEQPQWIKDQIPDFTTIFELTERYYEKNVPNPMIADTLLVACQLATLINSLEEQANLQLYVPNTCIIGLGFGLLAGAAVAIAENKLELISTSVNAVRIAFRTGMIVNRVSKQVQGSSNAQEFWSVLLNNVTPDSVAQELDEFHKSQKSPSSRKVYISAIRKGSVTISGSPLQLNALAKKPFFQQAQATKVPIHGLCHAKHLYGSKEIMEALGNSIEVAPRLLKVVLSTATGTPITASSSNELLEKVIAEILTQPLQWDNVLDGVVAHLQNSGTLHSQVLSFGTSHSSRTLVAKVRIRTNIKIKSKTTEISEAGQKGIEHASGRFANSNIAIVGMSCRLPGAPDVEALWSVLEEGRDLHKRIPKDRFDADTHVDPTGKKVNTSHTPYGCFIEHPGHFDARFFSMSPREAAQTDPMHRLALVTAYEALEQSGFVLNGTPSTQSSRVGTFYGQTSDDWREVNIAQKIDTFFIPGGVRAFAPGRINYFFKFSGPSYSVDTACSSSLAAIQLACTSLRNGECDTAVSGGLNVLTAPDIFAGLSRGMFLSKSGGCKTFDSQADGYCRADGVGTVILKRVEDALADKDNILGVILGAATNHSAEAISITHPHAGAQAFLYENILYNSGVDAQDVSYVEMHGTGTQAGDKTEATSVMQVFAPKNSPRKRPLHLGAVKSNIGHGEAAAGITALIKMLMMLRKNAIPPHIGIKNSINPSLPTDMVDRNVHIAMKMTPWLPLPGKKRIAFLNNFSAAGGNTALLLEEGPAPAVPLTVDPRPVHLVTVSAKTMSSFKNNVKNLVSFIDQHPNTPIADMAYTTTARRQHTNYRIAINTSSLLDLRTRLMASLEQELIPVSSKPPGVAFVYTGQGAFYMGMAKQLYEDSKQFKVDIDNFNDVAVGEGLPSFITAILGDVNEVLSPIVNQLAQVSVQMALTNLWKSWGLSPNVVIGHSLGEYAALNAAGVLSVTDTINLVGKRAELLVKNCAEGERAMLVIKSPLSAVESTLTGISFEVACINSHTETVICGSLLEVESANKALTAAGIKSMKIELPFAFHSTQVDPILAEFSEIAAGANFSTPKVAVASPLLGRVVSLSGTFNAKYLCRHARETVGFLDAIRAAESEKVIDTKTVWVEIGPHPICSAMIKSAVPSTALCVPSLKKKEQPWETVTNSLRSLYLNAVKINWREFHRGFDDSHTLLDLPLYSFDNKNYWIDYEGDWCLTKGNAAPIVAAPAPSQEIEYKPKLSTTTVHGIYEEEYTETTARVVTRSDITKPKMFAAVSGHLVNGSGLCPSSIYADMALTVVDYLLKEMGYSAPFEMDVCDMKVDKPLIANLSGSEPQLLHLTAEADIETGRAKLDWASVDTDGNEKVQHATCFVEFGALAENWLSNWAQIQYLVKGRINALLEGVETGSSQKIHRGMAYKLFSAFVDYDPKFRGMEEVVLDSAAYEATSLVSFQTKDSDGDFFFSPYWIDSLAHLSGFIMNGTDAVDSTKFVYVSHGWRSMRFSKTFSATTKYRSYVKMQPAGHNVVAGDVYIFEGDVIVAIVGGLKFQQIPRTILNTFLPPTKRTVSQTPVEKAPSKPAVTVTRAPALVPKPVKRATLSSKPAVKARVATPTAKKPAKASLGGSITSKAMDIVSAEAEIDLSELHDECVFAEIGIDSLLSLTITGKFREDLDLQVPGSLMLDHPTVKELKTYLSKFDSKQPVDLNEVELETIIAAEETSGDSSQSSDSSSEDGQATPPPDDDETLSVIRSTIADEMGLDIEEIVGSIDLGELGMDSLMTISILGRLRETLDISLSSNFFINNPTLDDVEAFLARESVKFGKSSVKQPSAIDVLSSYPPAVSILLQGNPKTASKTLFLFPDGSGSATSYAQIPDIASDVCVFGLNCPFMTTPKDYTIGIEAVSTIFYSEVRRRQPHGPYFLGGWSAGGVIGYEVAYQMIEAGEKVEKLILFDSPCPVNLEAIPHRLHVFFNDIGLLGSGGRAPPSWLLPHFESSIVNLTEYNPRPMDPKKAPKTLAIWATDGVCKNPEDPRPPPSDDDPKPMKWLLNNRTDFGYNGWDQILGGINITTTKLGCNHFTMMREPTIGKLSAIIKKALE